jgi:Domain of unknown function (DUF4129)
MLALAVRMISPFVTAWNRIANGTDPLGPNDIDPDRIRDGACDATAPGSVCSPRPRDAPDLPDSNPSSAPGVGGLANIFVLMLVVALAVALAWLAFKYFGGERLDVDADDDEDRTDIDESIDEAVDARVVDHDTPPDRWRRRAAEHRERGDFRESVRCEYRALVGDLARAGHVDEIPGRTSGEERAQVRDLAPGLGQRGPDVSAQFDVAADTFDSAWFDDGAVTRDDDQRFVAASQSVLDVMLAGAGLRRVGGRRS